MLPKFPSSFLDRLLPTSKGGVVAGRINLDDYLEILARDVSDLLNTFAEDRDLPGWAVECRDSILDYGLPDRVLFSAEAVEVARLIALRIERFEPRLTGVRVTASVPTPRIAGRLDLEIRADSAIEPGLAIAISALLDTERRHIEIVSIDPERHER